MVGDERKHLWSSHVLGMLAEIAILIHQLRHLLLQPIIFLHQKLVHGGQLPIHSLEARGLFSLLLSASVKRKTEMQMTIFLSIRLGY